MKAYKFERSCQGWHWSASMHEIIIYIPEVNIMLYDNGNKKGISKLEGMLEEAKEYIGDVVSGKIKREQRDVNNPIVTTSNSPYTTLPGSIFYDKLYMKEIPEIKKGHVTMMPVFLYNFEKINLDITEERIAELTAEQNLVKTEEERFENIKDAFQNKIIEIISKK